MYCNITISRHTLRVVCRSEEPLLFFYIRDDLFFIPYMIPGGYNIYTNFKELLSNLRCNTKTSGSVLTICYYKVYPVFVYEGIEILCNSLSPDLSYNITDKKYPHIFPVLLGKFYVPAFSYYCNLYLARICQFIMNLFSHLSCYLGGLCIRDILLLYYYANLPSCRYCIRLLNPFECSRNLFQVLKPFYICLKGLPSRTRPCTRKCISGCYKYTLRTDRLYISMMHTYCIYHLWIFTILLCHLHTYGHMCTFMFMGHGLANIMEQSGPLAQGNIKLKLCCHNPANNSHLFGMHKIILTITCPVFQPA